MNFLLVKGKSFIIKIAELDIRFILLIGLLVFLPTLEAPKNIFAFLFVFAWVIIAKKIIIGAENGKLLIPFLHYGFYLILSLALMQ